MSKGHAIDVLTWLVQEAVELVRDMGLRFNLALVDNEMPQLSGPETIGMMKELYDRIGHACCFVGLTGEYYSPSLDSWIVEDCIVVT